jgi:serine phosphatase RsbU (regulator of sigma subunit)
MVIHQTLREMPGPRAEMAAIIAHWDSTTHELEIANCAHVAPLILRDGGPVETLPFPGTPGLGARSTPKPSERSSTLLAGDRLLMVSDGVIEHGEGQAGLGEDGLIEAALRSQRGSAADTVREVHRAVIAKRGGELSDDATAVCLSIG